MHMSIRETMPLSVTVSEEQLCQKRKATQPSGLRFFLSPTSLLTPYRPRKGMRVARASAGPKIPRRKRGRIYEMGYLGAGYFQQRLVLVHEPPPPSAGRRGRRPRRPVLHSATEGGSRSRSQSHGSDSIHIRATLAATS